MLKDLHRIPIDKTNFFLVIKTNFDFQQTFAVDMIHLEDDSCPLSEAALMLQ